MAFSFLRLVTYQWSEEQNQFSPQEFLETFQINSLNLQQMSHQQGLLLNWFLLQVINSSHTHGNGGIS